MDFDNYQIEECESCGHEFPVQALGILPFSSLIVCEGCAERMIAEKEEEEEEEELGDSIEE